MWKEAECEWNVNGCDKRKNKLKNGKKENGTARGVVVGGGGFGWVLGKMWMGRGKNQLSKRKTVL